ncbi:hypothetical protein D9M69_577050 [compost metagenome]
MVFPFLIRLSKISRETKMAQKSEVPIPTSNVVAKPLIRPVPKMKRITPVMTEVSCESMIDGMAFLNPRAMAEGKAFPDAISSLTRS